jgi:hypothetical protein
MNSFTSVELVSESNSLITIWEDEKKGHKNSRTKSVVFIILKILAFKGNQ